MNSLQFVQTAWRKSSRSGSEGQMCVEVAPLWLTSTHSSGGGGQCVEVGVSGADRLVAVRDSKDPDGPVLSFTPDEWAGLLARIKSS